MSTATPPIGTKGLYNLKAPFITVANEIYWCGAIRTFTDVENFGQNVFTLYYEPYGLSESDYNTDKRNGEVIIALLSSKYPPIYVPSSYILSFPDLSSKNYHHVVLAASLGPIYEGVDLTFLKQQVAAVISSVIGMTPTINLGVAPMSGVVTPEQHDILEAARQSAVSQRTTDYARVVDLQTKNDALEQRCAILEGIVRDNGLIS